MYFLNYIQHCTNKANVFHNLLYLPLGIKGTVSLYVLT